MEIASEVKIQVHSGPVAAGQTDVEPSKGADTLGFHSVAFLVVMGAITSGAATSAHLECSTDDGDADPYTDIAGSSITIPADGDDKVFILELTNDIPERYVRCVVNRATEDSELTCIIAMHHAAEYKPVTQDGSVGASEIHSGAKIGTK